MKLDFVKMHGLGNDFVVIDNMDGHIALTADQVAFICDRHFGVGADGVILVEPSSESECAGFMNYINADGTFAQMCGNGVRCFGKFLVDHGYVSADDGKFVAMTRAGKRPIAFQVDALGHLSTATVNMGNPIIIPEEVPTRFSANAESEEGIPYGKECPLESPWGTFKFTCISMGNPHAICFIDDFSALPSELFDDPNNRSLESMNINGVGAFFEKHECFPEKTNVEFCSVAQNGIHMRVFERGCGETLACGTGACATNVAACLTGRAGRENDVILRGGTLHLNWTQEGYVLMTGTATASFCGTIEVD